MRCWQLLFHAPPWKGRCQRLCMALAPSGVLPTLQQGHAGPTAAEAVARARTRRCCCCPAGDGLVSLAAAGPQCVWHGHGSRCQLLARQPEGRVRLPPSDCLVSRHWRWLPAAAALCAAACPHAWQWHHQWCVHGFGRPASAKQGTPNSLMHTSPITRYKRKIACSLTDIYPPPQSLLIGGLELLHARPADVLPAVAPRRAAMEQHAAAILHLLRHQSSLV